MHFTSLPFLTHHRYSFQWTSLFCRGTGHLLLTDRVPHSHITNVLNFSESTKPFWRNYFYLERVVRIELTSLDWKSKVIIHYTIPANLGGIRRVLSTETLSLNVTIQSGPRHHLLFVRPAPHSEPVLCSFQRFFQILNQIIFLIHLNKISFRRFESSW